MNAEIIKFIEMNKDEETIKKFIITNLLKLTLKEQLIQCHHSMNFDRVWIDGIKLQRRYVFDFWHDRREPLYESVVKIHHSYAKTIVKTLMEYGDDEDILNAVQFCMWYRVEYDMTVLPEKFKENHTFTSCDCIHNKDVVIIEGVVYQTMKSWIDSY